MATPGKQIEVTMRQKIMLEQDYRSVLDILAEYESMPFLELSSLINMNEERLERIVDELEREGIVKITSRNSILDEIVTLRDSALASALSAP